MIGFDALLLSESTYGKPELSNADLVVPVIGVFVSGSASNRPISGKLVFKNAVRSVREVTEYIGDPREPDGFKEPYIEISQLAAEADGAREYGFEGVQRDPAAYIDWTVTAKGFEFIEDAAG